MNPRILVLGLDLDPDGEHISLGSRRAVELTRELAPKLGAKVLLVHSHHEDGEAFVGEDGAVGHRSAAGAVLAIEALSQELRDAGVDVESMWAAETPALALMRAATESPEAWVVIGKRSQLELDERRVGGVANMLLRTCPAPVLALDPKQPPQIRRIVAATDLTETGAKVTRVACEVAEATGAELDVVHAYQVPFELQMEAARMGQDAYLERRRALEAGHRDAMREACTETMRDRAKLRAVHTSPHRALKAAAVELNPDLLVLGTVSKKGIPGFFVGKTAERLLYDVDCSLLTVKPDGAPNPLA